MSSPAHRAVLFFLFLGSGAAGLVYELVWTRELTFVFGGTTYAISTVLVAFMGGLGLGSYVAGRWTPGLSHPARWYGVLEILIGVYALLVPLLLGLAEPAYRVLYAQFGDSPWLLTASRFILSAATLIIPTTAMGATLPILVRYVTLTGGSFGLAVGLLYGINTLGAVVGTLATGFVLIPALGLATTTYVAAATNLAIGVLAMTFLRSSSTAAATATRAPTVAIEVPAAPALSATDQRLLLFAFAVSGFCAMVCQIMWTRALVLSIGSSTYSFTSILAAFILGLSLGSLIVARWVDRWRDRMFAIGVIMSAIGVATVLLSPLYGQIPAFISDLVNRKVGDYSAIFYTQFAIVIAITLVPTLLMGTMFPLVTRAVARDAEDAGRAAGRAYGANTIGTILGSLLGGFVMIQRDLAPSFLGIQNSIWLAAALNALVGAALIYRASPAGITPAWRPRAALAAVALVAAVGVFGGRWDVRAFSAGVFLPGSDVTEYRRDREIIYFGEGVDLTVTVARTRVLPTDSSEVAKSKQQSLSLTVNGKTDASTHVRDVSTQLLLGHVPALLSPAARRVCIIGLGSGMTAGAVARYPQFERIDCIELSNEVIEGAKFFEPFSGFVLSREPRLHLRRADGRNHLLLTPDKYDLIISEPSNPWIAGVGNLFTLEFFELCEKRLSPDGRLCVWLHSYSMSQANFRLVVRTLMRVFPAVSIWEMSQSDFLLVAARAPLRVPLSSGLRAIEHVPVREDLIRPGRGQLHLVFGKFVASGQTLADWVGDGPLHRDDNATLEFSAPRAVYESRNLQIDHEFATMSCSPFPDTLTYDASNPAEEAVARRIDSAVASRRLRDRATAASSAEDLSGSLKNLIEAERQSPGDLDIFLMIAEARNQLIAATRGADAKPEVRDFLSKVEIIRFPTFSGRAGEPLSATIQGLRARASDEIKQLRWKLAADYLTEAAELDRSSADIAAELISALAGGGKKNDAFARLHAAVEKGLLTRSRLDSDPLFAALRDDPQFTEIAAAARP